MRRGSKHKTDTSENGQIFAPESHSLLCVVTVFDAFDGSSSYRTEVCVHSVLDD